MIPIRLRPLAEVDFVERTDYYRQHAGDHLAVRFFDTAVAALGSVGQMPLAGSPRAGGLCDIPGLRVWLVAGFPCGWYYFATTDHVDVVRLLADSQDLSQALASGDPEPDP